jgi:hypothetical protein
MPGKPYCLLRGLHLGHLELLKSPWLQGVMPLQQGFDPKNMAKIAYYAV